MERVLIGDLKDHIGKDVTINGWVETTRDHGKVAFLVLKDRSGHVQAVASNDYNETALPETQELREQYAVAVTGEVKERPEKMRRDEINGDLEFGIKEVRVLSKAHELPFDMDADLNLDTLLDYRPLTIRTKKAQAIFKTQATIITAYREFLNQEGFTEFQAPKLVGGDAEGGAEVFPVEYFNEKTAYLATSPQLYKQIMVGGFERAFTTGQMFRAEKSATTRHLSEISMLDFEMGFVKDHTDVMHMTQELLRYITKKVEEERMEDLKFMGVEAPKAPETFPVFTLREAQELIKKETGEDKTDEPDLEPEDERFLCEYAHKNLNSDFVFVTHFPTSKRPFYTAKDPGNPEFTRSFDLLFRGLEMCSGGQRVHDYDELIERIKDKGLDPDKFHFYLQAFKYGMPPHGGIGMGLERLTAKFLNVTNIKEATLFPRDMNRIDTLLSQDESND
ncbi:MAG: aspartate--tRNA(Asn) ligase [Patescibacteria group bacterium UBA2103]